MRRLVRCLFVTMLFGLLSMLGLETHPASAQPATNPNTYSLTAEGDGELYKVVNDQLPASTTEEVSPYSAQASNDSTGNSTAFAGLPYPGPVGSTIEGTVNGLSGGATPPIPPAPGYVSVTYPGHSTADESQGPYVVQATAGQNAASAKAGFGISPNASSDPSANQQLFSTASVVANADGSVSASASAGVDGLNVGVLDALNVSSTETITETGNGVPSITGSSKLGTFQVLGFTIGITPSGFDVVGANLPLPTSTILSEVNSFLGKGGTKLTILPGAVSQDAATGATDVTSDSLEVTTVQNVPALGPTTVTYDFGRVTVTAADVDTGSSTGTTLPASVPGASSSGGQITTPAADTSSGSGSGSVGVPAGTGSVDTGTPVSAAPSLAVTPSGSGSTSLPSAPSSSSGSSLPTTLGYLPAAMTGVSVHGIYLILVLAGLGALGASTLFRHFGIRLVI